MHRRLGNLCSRLAEFIAQCFGRGQIQIARDRILRGVVGPRMIWRQLPICQVGRGKVAAQMIRRGNPRRRAPGIGNQRRYEKRDSARAPHLHSRDALERSNSRERLSNYAKRPS